MKRIPFQSDPVFSFFDNYEVYGRRKYFYRKKISIKIFMTQSPKLSVTCDYYDDHK